jgi:hypothetical protein
LKRGESMGFYERARDLFKDLPNSLITTHMIAKFIFGIGLGILICEYYDFNRVTVGWGAIVVAFVVAIPSTVRIFSQLFKSD